MVGLQNVTTFFELGQLGVDLNSDELFVHGDMVSQNDSLHACGMMSMIVCVQYD